MLRALPPLTVGLLLLTPLMIAAGQVLFKMTSERLVAADATFVRAAFDPVFIAAVALYGFATILWIWVLKQVPLSFAYSFMAMTFVFVPLLAIAFLGETVGLKYVAGTTLIIAGLLVANL